MGCCHGTGRCTRPGTSSPASSEALPERQKNGEQRFGAISANPQERSVFLSVQDEVSELLLLVLGACVAHKVLVHLKLEIVANMKHQGISYGNLDF